MAIDVITQWTTKLNNIIATNPMAFANRVTDYLKLMKLAGGPCSSALMSSINQPDPLLTVNEFTLKTKTLCPVLAYENQLTNSNPNVAVDSMVQYEKALDETFSFSFSETLSITQTIKVYAGIGILGGESTISGTFSFTAAQAWTKRETRTWRGGFTARVDPGRGARLKVMVNNSKMTAGFHGVVRLLPDSQIILTIMGPKGAMPLPAPLGALFTQEEIVQVAVDVSGEFHGVEGVSVDTFVEPYPT